MRRNSFDGWRAMPSASAAGKQETGSADVPLNDKDFGNRFSNTGRFQTRRNSMGDKGKRDKGRREKQKKAQLSPKEKRRLKREKRNK
jgi:hypothetical protein